MTHAHQSRAERVLRLVRSFARTPRFSGCQPTCALQRGATLDIARGVNGEGSVGHP
jgi:hypothetical protein